MAKTFVSIAAYRDPELLPTLKDLLSNCSNPDDLHICIGWQHSHEVVWDTLDEYKNDSRFTIIDVDYKDAKGVCWMRKRIQDEYRGEEYYLQLDSHHRFSKNWDITLKDYIHYLQSKGSLKPLLSAYIPGYFPKTDPEGRVDEVWGLNIQRFMPSGVIFLEPHHVDNWKELKEPFKARFISAHFIFTLGKFVKEVPYDEHLYFHGEESSLAARAYTYGYDLFSPHRPVIWHEYTREGKKKHWDDSSDWSERDSKSYARYRKLMGVEEGCTPCQRKQMGALHYFGTERTFEQYEKYAGLRFKTRQIHIETKNNDFPPIKGDYESGLTNTQKYCIDIYKGSLTESDYDSLVVAFLDEYGQDMFRKDADQNEIKTLLNSDSNDQFIHIWRTFDHVKKPHTWRVWPHSESKGWMERIEQVISYE
jgi:hypothetical protein